MTGYNQEAIRKQIKLQVTLELFFNEAPNFNPNASKIKGVICGCRVEDIPDPLMQKIRYLDKLVDDLSKGKSVDALIEKYTI